MAGIVSKSFDSPDEKRTPDKTTMHVVDLGGAKAARITFQPGWRWSECIKPVVGTDSCQVHHVGTAISGTLRVVHNDGTEVDVNAGDAYLVEAGHDAWVVGDAPFESFEFDTTAAATYAKP